LQNYNSSDLQQFEGLFRHSKVLGLIDNTNSAITSNSTNITMGQKFTPTTTATTSILLLLIMHFIILTLIIIKHQVE
jgi:hypothetical protein